MIYRIQMKTESVKTSCEFLCNDFDQAMKFFKMCINGHWDILGDIEIKLIKCEENQTIYQLIKGY